MVTIKKLFVFATSVLSGIGVLFTTISLATEQWIYTDSAKLITNNTEFYNTIKYGLFQGTLTTAASSITVQITMTCLAKENVCAVLCAKNEEARYALLKDLYNGKEGIDQNQTECPHVSRTVQYNNRQISRVLTDSATTNKKFINCGVWVSTIFFLVLSIVFGLISAALSLYNTVSNPVQVYLSIYGIFLYNGIALISVILAITLWGVMFNLIIYHDVAIFYTLYDQMTSDKTAVLGYSYWLNIIPIIFYSASICVLYVRHYMISQDPKQKMVQREEAGDPALYLY